MTVDAPNAGKPRRRGGGVGAKAVPERPTSSPQGRIETGVALEITSDMLAATRIMSITEARNSLGKILARFANEGAAAAPVEFGSRRKAQAVLLSPERYSLLRRLSAGRTGLTQEQSVQGPSAEMGDRCE